MKNHKVRRLGRIAASLTTSLVLSTFGLFSSLVAESPLPSDPQEWACHESPPTQQEIDAWCQANPNRGKPAYLGTPGSLLDIDAKNAYDEALTQFVMDQGYDKLGWLHDKNWRMTGPYVGKPGSGLSYGVHPAVRIYYSPEVVDWLCEGRPANGIPDGAMIIKAMHEIDEELKIELDEEGCMDITAPNDVLDESMTSWTIMVKDQGASHDGWYWPNPYKTSGTYGNPPILDKSAFVKADQVPVHPTKRNPDMYPTGNNSRLAPISNQVYPYNGFGVACLNCHGSAEVESTFSSLENIMSAGIRYKWYKMEESPQSPPSNPPFPTPMDKASPEFLSQFNQLHAVSFAEAWDLRLPAETYDHVVPKAGKKKEFLTSDQCIACHDATISNSGLPNMMHKEEDGTLINLSMYGEWRVSPMGLAGRDPIFFSQLQSETNNLPSLASCIENTCLHCHGVLGQRQFSRETVYTDEAKACKEMIYAVQPPDGVPQGGLYPLSMVTQWQNGKHDQKGKYGALSRDGISCMACHQMEPDTVLPHKSGYGESDSLSQNQDLYTGNFETTPDNVIYGPLKDSDIVPKPMEHVLGITPKYGEQIKTSEMCGNCHNILLPEITNDQKIVGYSYEQTTHLEWANSIFAQPDSGWFQSCQDCHMPHNYQGEPLKFKIANIESSDFAPTTFRLPDKDIQLDEVSPYPRHALHGLNIFLNQMFQQFPAILGLRQIDYMNGNDRPSLMTGQDSMLEMARKETATVTIEDSLTSTNDLDVTVLVTNKVGHYLPSGVGFRRAFLEFLVLDENDKLLWASGRTNSLGMILDGTTDTPLPSESPVDNPKVWQPHYEVISMGSQAQIYQEVILDSANDVTTSFLRRIKHVKDNRLRPKGFDPKFYEKQSSEYIKELAELHETENDPYYYDPKLTGADKIRYSIPLSSETMKKVAKVQVTLFSQSIPPPYLQERFRDANRGPGKKNEIERLYYLTSHMNMDSPVDRDKKPFLKDWKLQISTPAVKTFNKGN